MTEITTHQELLNKVQEKTSVVMFHADWCPACKNYAPQFEQQSGKFQDAQFLRFDMDKLRDTLPSNMQMLSAEVNAYPTIMGFRHTEDGIKAFVSANGDRSDDVIAEMVGSMPQPSKAKDEPMDPMDSEEEPMEKEMYGKGKMENQMYGKGKMGKMENQMYGKGKPMEKEMYGKGKYADGETATKSKRCRMEDDDETQETAEDGEIIMETSTAGDDVQMDD